MKHKTPKVEEPKSPFELAIQKIAQTPKAKVERAIERDREKKAR